MKRFCENDQICKQQSSNTILSKITTKSEFDDIIMEKGIELTATKRKKNLNLTPAFSFFSDIQ